MAQETTPHVAAPAAPAGWKRMRRARPVPQHDWQVEPLPERLPVARWRPLRLACCFTLLTALFGVFLLVALDVPEKTPLLIVSDLRTSSIPQSPWLAEEIDRLKLLDGTTLTVGELSPAASPGATVTEFRRSLQRLAPTAARTRAVIVYLRLPGLVDDAGRPCLVPSPASLVRTEDWLPVETLLDQAAGDVFPRNVRRLVILDRCQPSTVWQAGALADPFADRLAALVNQRHHAGQWATLHVLTDTSGAQKGWSSPALGGSVFGEAVWSALTGMANGCKEASKVGGRADRHVSLTELAQFVTCRTAAWVHANRGQAQTPRLYSADSADYRLFWVAPNSDRQAWQEAAERMRMPVGREAAQHRLKQFWTARRTLDALAPGRFDPVAWQQFNQRLVQYERLLDGGASAARQRDEIDRAIQSLLATLNEVVLSRSPLSGERAGLPHRQLARKLNPECAATCERVAAVFDQIRRRPSRQVAADLLHDLRRDESVANFQDLVILGHLVDDAPDSAWAQPELLTRTLSVMERLGELQALRVANASLMLEAQYQPVQSELRTILDCLFVGTDERLDVVRTALTGAEQRLSDCEQMSRELLLAFDGRNRAAADLPRLAEWIYASGAREASLDAQGGIDDWRAAANSWQQLETALSQCGERGATAESAALTASLATRLERELSVLWTRVERTYERLLNGVPDAMAVAEMERLLATSVLPRQPDSQSRGPVEQRSTLREAWRQASTQRAIRFAVGDSEGHASHGGGPAVPDSWTIEIGTGAAPHPMLKLLGITDETNESVEASSGATCERSSQSWKRSVRVRRELATIRQAFQRARHASYDSTIARHFAWRSEARHARTAAMWLSNELSYNPSQRMELAAIGRLLRNRAADAVVDYWHGPSDTGPPFFAQAAEELLDAADLCEADSRESLSEAGRAEANRTRRLLAAARDRTASPLEVSAITVPQILATDELRTEVEVRRLAGGLLTSGVAAVFLSRDDKSTERAIARESVVIPAPSDSARETAATRVALRCSPSNELSEGRPPCRAYVWFRGHRFADDFQLAPTGGLAVRSAAAADAPTTVTVRSDRGRPAAMLFVLDASASMTDEVAREGTRGAVRKIDAAVEALTALLSDFADENDARVGVMFYGHRVAAGETAADGLQRQPLYQRRFPFPATLQPYEDVETVLRVGRFGPAELGRVEDRLQALRPWGETPLYLSIVEGLAQLDAGPADTTKTLIVITDGLNYQFNAVPEKRTQVDDVLRAAQGRDVAVHLLGFGVPEKDVEQARVEFSRISAATGGSADVTVRDAARLQSRLRALYQPSRFTVTNDDGFQATAEAGQAITLSRDRRRQVDQYEVRYESAVSRITIEGGERLVFRPADDGTLRVVSDLPYLRTSLREHDSGANSPYELAAARPEKSGDDLTVRWSLCRRDGRFAPRPAVGYFRVQPLDARGRELGPAAICLGSPTVAGRSTPTWEFQIPNWPREASIARLEGWVRSSPVEPEQTETCANLILRQQANDTWQALPVPAVRWQVRHDGRSVTLVERYDDAAAEPRVWTELQPVRDSTMRNAEPPRPTLLNVERRHDAEHRLFVQTWNLDRELTPSDLSELQLRFTSLEAPRPGDLAMAEPLLLSTIPQALVIRPAPTTLR